MFLVIACDGAQGCRSARWTLGSLHSGHFLMVPFFNFIKVHCSLKTFFAFQLLCSKTPSDSPAVVESDFELSIRSFPLEELDNICLWQTLSQKCKNCIKEMKNPP